MFTLSRSGALYANKRLLTKSVTSFLLTSAHLIYTTAQHLLKFVHITKVDGIAKYPNPAKLYIYIYISNDLVQILKYQGIPQKRMRGAEALSVEPN